MKGVLDLVMVLQKSRSILHPSSRRLWEKCPKPELELTSEELEPEGFHARKATCARAHIGKSFVFVTEEAVASSSLSGVDFWSGEGDRDQVRDK